VSATAGIALPAARSFRASVERLRVQQRDRLRRRRGAGHDGLRLLEKAADHAARVVLVVDDQHAQAGDAAVGVRGDAGALAHAALVALGRLRRRDDRQQDREGRPLAGAFAGDAHRAAVQLDELLDDGQSEPEAAVAAGRAGVGLAEAVEHERQEIGTDALAGVADLDLEARVDAADADLDVAAGRREFHRVAE
jgi:hypothetical protein